MRVLILDGAESSLSGWISARQDQLGLLFAITFKVLMRQRSSTAVCVCVCSLSLTASYLTAFFFFNKNVLPNPSFSKSSHLKHFALNQSNSSGDATTAAVGLS